MTSGTMRTLGIEVSAEGIAIREGIESIAREAVRVIALDVLVRRGVPDALPLANEIAHGLSLDTPAAIRVIRDGLWAVLNAALNRRPPSGQYPSG